MSGESELQTSVASVGSNSGTVRARLLFAMLAVAVCSLIGKVALSPADYRSAIESLCAIDPRKRTAYSEARPDGGWVLKRDGRRWLWGGSSEAMHFDVTSTTLDLNRLRYGLGREAFAALIEPEFVSVQEAAEWLGPKSKVLCVHYANETRVYPVNTLARHEVVNDTLGGQPILAAYCVLADLGAIYDRRMGDHEFTFAVSGYTCGHPEVWDGRQAFVLWDRDTESLWWPTIGKAVSGPMMGAHLKLFDRRYWRQTTWQEIVAGYPEAKVLAPNQDMERPRAWLRFHDLAQINRTNPAPPVVAPRWGASNLKP